MVRDVFIRSGYLLNYPLTSVAYLVGHVCLTDFGLAKDFGVGLNDDEENQRANTICGTQEYMAPVRRFTAFFTCLCYF